MLIIAMKTEKVEKGYQLMLVSFIKKCLEMKDPKRYQEWYGLNEDKIKKNFAMALSMPRNVKMDEDNYYPGLCHMKISSNDIIFLSHIRSAVEEMGRFEYKDTVLEYVGADFIPIERPTQNIVVSKTISPIYLRTKNGDLPQTWLQLAESFAHYAAINIRAAAAREPIEPITLLQHEWEIKNVDVRMHNFYKKKPVYRGMFAIQGHPDDLHILLQSGIGMNTSLGFGLVKGVM
jgi:CRISPR-associated endoribonuclease Cas6